MMSLKELEEEKKKLKENQQRNVSLFLIWGQTMQTKSGLMSVLMFNRDQKTKTNLHFRMTLPWLCAWSLYLPLPVLLSFSK